MEYIISYANCIKKSQDQNLPYYLNHITKSSWKWHLVLIHILPISKILFPNFNQILRPKSDVCIKISGKECDIICIITVNLGHHLQTVCVILRLAYWCSSTGRIQRHHIYSILCILHVLYGLLLWLQSVLNF